jgi:6-phosphogluconolactonase
MGKEPRNFTLDPSGKWLLVANQESDSIVIFWVDPQTGMIRPTGRRLTVPRPTCLKME